MPERAGQDNVVVQVLAAMDRLRVPYMVVGSMAVNYYGLPRSSHDLDLVVQVSVAHVPGLLAEFQKEFYISEDGIKRALRTGSSFNAIHLASGLKVDFWPLKDLDFEQGSFARRASVSYLDAPAVLISPEDLILKKLQWQKESGSEKHWTDAETVFMARRATLDRAYIGSWAAKLHLQEAWARLQQLPEEKVP
jgi:hypothetical protein